MAKHLVPEGIDRIIVSERIAELELELERSRKLLDAPQEPQAVHSVVRFVKYDQRYTFAAIKAYTDAAGIGIWFLTQDGSRTSRQGHAPKYWADLLRFIGERNLHTLEVLS